MNLAKRYVTKKQMLKMSVLIEKYLSGTATDLEAAVVKDWYERIGAKEEADLDADYLNEVKSAMHQNMISHITKLPEK